MKRLFYVVTVLGLSGALALPGYLPQSYRTDSVAVSFPPPAYRAARNIYAFSVVPGGVYNAMELEDSAAADPVVRSHYEGIRIDALRLTRSHALLAYVSYRKGSTVRWTTHRVLIAAGEPILTDGENLVRARCGNRIVLKLPASTTPGRPVEPDPPDVVFDSPAIPSLVPPTISMPLSPAWPQTRRPVPPLPTFSPLPPSGGGPGDAESGKPIPVPVPDSATLLLSGLAAAIAAQRIVPRKRR